jgi:hypothetical protein
MAKRLRDAGFEGAEVVAECANLEEWALLPNDKEADLVVAECPTLFEDKVDLIVEKTQAAGALRAIVVYHFCQDSVRERLEGCSANISALRAPISAEELKSACEADMALASIRSNPLPDVAELMDIESIPASLVSEEIPPRQFSDEALSDISQISTAIGCECPHHMSSLLMALNAFELYSKECENKTAADAMLHAFLHRRTAHARSILEDALTVLAEAEGIEVG